MMKLQIIRNVSKRTKRQETLQLEQENLKMEKEKLVRF